MNMAPFRHLCLFYVNVLLKSYKKNKNADPNYIMLALMEKGKRYTQLTKLLLLLHRLLSCSKLKLNEIICNFLFFKHFKQLKVFFNLFDEIIRAS